MLFLKKNILTSGGSVVNQWHIPTGPVEQKQYAILCDLLWSTNQVYITTNIIIYIWLWWNDFITPWLHTQIISISYPIWDVITDNATVNYAKSNILLCAQKYHLWECSTWLFGWGCTLKPSIWDYSMGIHMSFSIIHWGCCYCPIQIQLHMSGYQRTSSMGKWAPTHHQGQT